MKRIGMLVVLLALGGMGCSLTSPYVQRQEVPPKMVEESAPVPVTADSVDEKNAAEKAKALRVEMMRESQPKNPEATDLDQAKRDH